MKKSLLVILAVGVIFAGIIGLAYAGTNINYQIDPTTRLLWDERMVTHFPDVAYVNVEPGVEKFGIKIYTDAPGPICLEITAPNGQRIYDLYDFNLPPHNLGGTFCAKKYGTGKYTVKVYQAHTSPLTYTLTLTGPLGAGTNPCCDDFDF